MTFCARTPAEIEEYLKHVQAWEALETVPYNRTTKPQFDIAVAEILSLRDYRSAMVKDCRKSELPSVIAKVARRTRVYLSEVQALLDDKRKREEARAEYQKTMQARYALCDKAHAFKDQFDVREFDCISACIEDGIITRENIHEYGIKLED